MKHLVSVAVALVALGLMFHFISAARTTTPPGPGHNGQSGFTVRPAEIPKRLLIEAEDVVEISPPFSVVQGATGPAAGASGGKCCYVGPEKWNDKWKSGQVTGEYAKGHEEAQNPGFARYRFAVPETGDYVLWIRAYWVDDCGNSLDISINGSKPGGLTGSTFRRWLWHQFRDVENAPVRIRLEAGRENVLTICNREDDVYYDQILLLDADHPVDPVGIQH